MPKTRMARAASEIGTLPQKVKPSKAGVVKRGKPGEILCLKCDRLFLSKDRKRNRICAKCTVANQALGADAEIWKAPWRVFENR